MANNEWEIVEQILDEALEKSDSERKTFIEERCGENDRLKSWVTELLESIESSEGFMETGSTEKEVLIPGMAGSISTENDSSLIGTSLGAYTIKELIGHGGMGSVYLAHRSDGTFEHRVAVKIIRRGMDTPSNRARFIREQNILARLHHPHIARLYGGGLTDEGLPYLLMEYIDGQPIDLYCDQQKLSLSERLKLFNRVCKAVQYAHENLIVHRDLKPDNILIKPDGQVKILDFGIAKLLDTKLGKDAVHQTEQGARMLTLAYAAPEQLKGDSITTAADTYALGTILYKLLSGAKPFIFSDKSRARAEELIRDKRPPKPSSRFQALDSNTQLDIAGNRKTTPDQLSKQLGGDLDAIISKALRKEASTRYRSPEHLEEDVERFLRQEPVSARSGNVIYKSRKFFSRHKVALASLAGFLLILTVVSTFYTLQIAKERNQAKLEAQTANQVTEFLIDLFEANDPSNNRGEQITALQLLAEGEGKIGQLNEQPEVQARLTRVLGDIYSILSYPQKADSLKSQSLALATQWYESSDPQLATFYHSLAVTKHIKGAYDEALTLLESAIEIQKAELTPLQQGELANSLRLKARILKDQGSLDSAHQAIQESRKIFENADATENGDYLMMLKELGAIQSEMGDFPESESTFRKALALSKTLYDSPHPDILACMRGLAHSLKEQSHFQEAEKLYQKGIAMNQTLYGPRHLNTATLMNNLAGLYYYTDKLPEADSLYARSHQIYEEQLGGDHPNVASILYNWANVKVDMKDLSTAEQLYREVLRMDIKLLGADHPNVASDHTGIAVLMVRQKKYEEAIKHFSRSLEIRRNIYDANHPYIAYNLRSIAQVNAQTGNFETADSLFRQSLAILISVYEEEDAEISQTLELYERSLGNWDNALSTDSLRSWLATH